MNMQWETAPGRGQRVDCYQICVSEPRRLVRVWTWNSVYDIEVTEPAVRRALVRGGSHFDRPRLATVVGARRSPSEFCGGNIAVGARLELHLDGQAILTSPIWCIELQ